MVRVGLGLYKYSIAYRWKHSITNGMSVSILVMLLTHYQKQQLILQMNSNLLLLHAESTDEISACKPATNIRESVDSLCRDGADAQYMQYLSKSRITSPQTR